MRKKFSLKLEFILGLLVFVFLILGLIFVLQTTFLDNFYSANKIKALESTAHTIASNIDDEELEDILNKYTLSNEVCVRIVSNKVSVTGFLDDSVCALRRLDDQMINQLNNEVDANGGQKLFSNYGFMAAENEKIDIYIYGEKTKGLNGESLILVSSMITPLTTTIETIKSQYTVIVLIVLLVTILFGFVMSKIILKPINAISHEVNNLPNGNYHSKDIKVYNRELEQLNHNLAEANNEIVKADKTKKDLVANVSHDLRTPLTMIVGYGEMMKDIKKERTDDNLEIIVSEAKRLNTLVDDLIDVSKASSGTIELHKEELSINKLLNTIYSHYKKYAKDQKIDFKLDISEDQDVYLDENRITQVIYNFLNNAFNYNSKKKKQVILGTEKVNGKLMIYVYDNGDGINEEDLDNVWDRYYKVDKEHKRSSLGSGIGLSLARDILKLHDFEYGVESKANEYSKFYFFV